MMSDFEISDSLAFNALDDLEKSKELNSVEAQYLRNTYTKLFNQLTTCKHTATDLTKKCNQLNDEIINQNFLYEKCKIEESDELRQFRKLEDTKSEVLKDLELAEQQEMISKFELSELVRIHDELSIELNTLNSKNENLVTPIINILQSQIDELNKRLVDADVSFDRESKQKIELVHRINDFEKLVTEKKDFLILHEDALKNANCEPLRIIRQSESLERAFYNLEIERNAVTGKLSNVQKELEMHKVGFSEAEKLRKILFEKLDINRKTLQNREQEVSAVNNSLTSTKSKVHDLITRKVELNVHRKESEIELRKAIDHFNFSKKDYELLKKQLKKKRILVDSINEVIPKLQDQHIDYNQIVESLKEESRRKCQMIATLKTGVEDALAVLLSIESNEFEKKEELEAVLLEYDRLELEIQHWISETKHQSKLIALLSAQRDVKCRDSNRIVNKEIEAKQHVKIKELNILDLTKRCNEISNRLKEFSALFEVVKNERNKYVNLIQSSAQALAEMKEKIRILSNEVEILGNESSAKDVALTKEKAAYWQAQRQRDSLRQDMNRLLSEYRTKQSTVEQQIQDIDKMNIVVSKLEKEMIEIKRVYEKAVEYRNLTGVQLIDRNDELCILYERANTHKEILRKGELDMISKEEELRMLRIQTEDLKRQYLTARKRLPELLTNKASLQEIEDKLTREKMETEDLSVWLEDPHNLERWRPLDGIDDLPEEVVSKLAVFENRVDLKREQLLEKELVLEEITALTEKLKEQATVKRDSAKDIADKLNSMQHKIRLVTKTMLATVSELSMYQATALRLQQEKSDKERTLEESRWNFDHGKPPSDDAIKDFQYNERKKDTLSQMRNSEEAEWKQSQLYSLVKSTAEPRPTAYIPDDLGIPKPYGIQAPFKPSIIGSTMRHTKVPVVKTIDL